MQRRSVWQWLLFVALAFLQARTACAQAGRLMLASGVTERTDHIDLTIEFTCSLPYRTHAPAAEADRLRITLSIGADCRLPAGTQFPGEYMLPPEGRDLVRGIELQPGPAGGAELVISWNRVEKYVLAPTSGMRGIRIRVLRTPPSRVTVGEAADPTADYAVNLESSQQPFDELALSRATTLLQTTIYVSTLELDGVRWYRLRAGPFATRREASEVLKLAQSRYPSAWLAINDEAVATPEEAAAQVTVPGTPLQRATRPDAALDRQLESARAALNARRLDEAIRSLTPVVAVEDYARRPEAAELLGLARERNGQLAQAKAVYEDYLRRYPDNAAAGRIRERLQALRLADVPGRAGTGGGGNRNGWSAWGNAAQYYRRDETSLSGAGLSRDAVTQNAVLTDIDGLVRLRSERRDITGRSSIGYMKDLQGAGREDRLRISTAYAEVTDRELALSARVGRQSRGMAGVNGLFDGALGTWQAKPRLGTSFAIGAPVENTRKGPDFQRLFVASAVDFAWPGRAWEASAFMVAQQYHSRTDRRSIGLEARYIKPGRTLVTMADYDIGFGALNSVMVLGTLITPSHWTFNLDASLQRAPQLGIRNALIGQPTLAFSDLTSQFTTHEIEQLALDRSAQLAQLSATASHPLGDHGQWTVTLSSFDLSSTPASGGVAAVPSTGRDDTLRTELLFNSLMRAGDTHSIALQAQQGGNFDLLSAGIASRIPLGGAWRMTSRARLDRRDVHSDDSRSWLLTPSLRVDYQRKLAQFEFEAGVELDRRHSSAGTDRTTRRYLYAGYRLFLERRQP